MTARDFMVLLTSLCFLFSCTFISLITIDNDDNQYRKNYSTYDQINLSSNYRNTPVNFKKNEVEVQLSKLINNIEENINNTPIHQDNVSAQNSTSVFKQPDENNNKVEVQLSKSTNNIEENINNTPIHQDVKKNNLFQDVITLIKSDKNKHTTGLKNIGLTCFMNAVLQVFANLPNFMLDFWTAVSNKYKELTDTENSEDPRISLTIEFIKVMQALWTGDNAYAPTDFKKALDIASCSEFEDTENNNPYNLLCFLLDNLSETLTSLPYKPLLPAANDNESIEKSESVEESKPVEESLLNIQNHSNSIIYDYFRYERQDCYLCEYGKTQKKQNCDVLETSESVYSFSIGKYRSLKYKINPEDKSIPYDNAPVSVQDCFDIYKKNFLTGKTKYVYDCDSCNKKNQICYQTALYTRIPRILSVVIRVNDTDLSITAQIDEEINLGDFISPKKDKEEYWLSSIICHSGPNNATEGHLVTINRHTATDPWYLYNDGKVSKAQSDQMTRILNGTDKFVPCILFYVKKEITK